MGERVLDISMNRKILTLRKMLFSNVGAFTHSSLTVRVMPTAFRDDVADLMVHLECCVLADETGKEVVKVVEFVHPASWWQHFKQGWPKWMKRRFPPVMETTKKEIRWTVRGYYPYSNLTMPDHMGDRIQMTQEGLSA